MSIHKLHPRLQDFVKNKNWSGLTSVQEMAFDPVFTGKDCIIEAPTSGGKTEAVLFPLLTRISGKKTEGFKILYIAPLKALLNDLSLRIMPYAEMCYLEAFKWHGDVSQSDKIAQMLFPADILLTTPESVEAMLLRKANWREVFSSLETIVIDEAHYFALTERGAHLVSLLERITAGIGRYTQRIGVTATIGNPDELLSWLTGNREGGVRIQVQNTTDKERKFSVHYFDDPFIKKEKLYALLQNKKTIVFDRSRSGTEETAKGINEMNQASGNRLRIKIKTHHSSVSKQLREEAEKSIKSRGESSLHAVISTSTLELGIDIGELNQVVQLGPLNSAGSFLQRVGRTGRREGQSQVFISLCDDPEDLILITACVSLGLKKQSENILFPKRAFHILAHQVICLILQNGGVTTEQIWNILARAACFSRISRPELEDLLRFMEKNELLGKTGKDEWVTGLEAEHKYLNANWRRLFAIFDTGPMYNVVDGKKIIGTLDSDFARLQDLPFVFVLGGQEWYTLKIDHETQQIRVRKNESGIVPKWRAISDMDVPFELAREAGILLTAGSVPAFLDTKARQIFTSIHRSINDTGWSADNWSLIPADDNGTLRLWTWAGDKINRSLYLLLLARGGMELNVDYKGLNISGKDEKTISGWLVEEYLMEIKQTDENTLFREIEKNIRPSWFSKFSPCLPDNLSKKTLCEKSTDIPGLIRELNINPLTIF